MRLLAVEDNQQHFRNEQQRLHRGLPGLPANYRAGCLQLFHAAPRDE
jgi:hypothetical protein